MRIALLGLLGLLIAAPAMAQGYHYGPDYGYRPDARSEWHQARRAEDTARWRAANGDYWGARRAHYWAEQHRERAHWDAHAARGGW